MPPEPTLPTLRAARKAIEVARDVQTPHLMLPPTWTLPERRSAGEPGSQRASAESRRERIHWSDLPEDDPRRFRMQLRITYRLVLLFVALLIIDWFLYR